MQFSSYTEPISNKGKDMEATKTQEQHFDFTSAMDELSTNVFFCDVNLKLVYMNKLAIKTMANINQEILKQYGFDSNSLIGRSIDEFHKNPSHQRKILFGNEHAFPFNTEITIGPLILDLNIAKSYGVNGEVNGFIVKWEEISAKKNAENKAAMMSNMVDLSPINIMMADKEGTLLYMNKNSEENLKLLEKHLPDKVDVLVGNKIDWFHQTPEKQRRIIADPKNLPHRAIIEIGSDKLDLLVSAIFDNEGEYIGPMVTWKVITTSEKMELINELSDASSKLSESSSNLLGFANQLSANAEETTSQSNLASNAGELVKGRVATMSTNMEEMSASISEISKNTTDSFKKSKHAMEIADNANELIQNLGNSSQDIGEVIKVITSIAQQTNLLALNATIEAARAGEHGKGFSVVAEEVGTLAKSSGEAAHEIEEMLSKQIDRVNTVIEETQSKIDTLVRRGSDKVEIGKQVSQECRSALEQILEKSSNLDAAIEEIAAASIEQSQGIQEISRAMDQLDDTTRRNSLIAQEVSKETEILNTQSDKLKSVSKVLNELVYGEKSFNSPGIAKLKETSTKPKKEKLAEVIEIKPEKTEAKQQPQPAPEAPVKKVSGGEDFSTSSEDDWEDL